MRTAKDGLPFDEDRMGELKENEVEIIQFLRPLGKRRRMACEVPPEIKKLAEDQILSSEELRTGEIAIYSRLIGEGKEREIMLLAENGPGKKSPPNVLIEVIKRKNDIR